MTDEAVFLSALAAAPDDDAARGAYADWLDEQGRADDAYQQRAVIAVKPVLADPDDNQARLEFADWAEWQQRPSRASLVRTQMQLKRLARCPVWCDHDPDRCDQTRLGLKVDLSLGPCQTELCGPVSGMFADRFGIIAPRHDVQHGQVIGGFIEALTLPGPVWIEHADWLTAHHPIRRVHLTTVPVVVHNPGFEGRDEGRMCCFERADGTHTKPHRVSFARFPEVAASRLASRLCEHYWPGIHFTFGGS